MVSFAAKLCVLPCIIFADVLTIGLVKLLFVNVSVVALPTNVSEDVGNVIVPVFLIVLNEGVYVKFVTPVPVAS